MRIKYVPKNSNGLWYIAQRDGRYFINRPFGRREECAVECLREEARDLQRRIDEIDRALEKMGALDAKDPHGYLA